jgi:hypothetical protein
VSVLLIEHIGPGNYRVTNGSMTIDVHGPTLEEALVTALGKAGITSLKSISTSFRWAKALQTVMEAE